MITLITGGAGTGKTLYALKLASAYSLKAYIATAEETDKEMALKIYKHKKERDHTYTTYEEPLELHQALESASIKDVAVVDCITFWVNNILYYNKDINTYKEQLLKTLSSVKKPVIIVTNEISTGIVPQDALTRNFVNTTARINREIADIANNLILMVAGQPLYIKGER